MADTPSVNLQFGALRLSLWSLVGATYRLSLTRLIAQCPGLVATGHNIGRNNVGYKVTSETRPSCSLSAFRTDTPKHVFLGEAVRFTFAGPPAAGGCK